MIAKERINRQTIALEEAETKIRQTVKYEYFARTPKTAIDKKIQKIFVELSREIKNPVLKRAGLQSLRQFYERQYRELVRSFSKNLAVMESLYLLQGISLNGKKIRPSVGAKRNAVCLLEENGYEPSRLLGSPLKKYTRKYINENIKPAFERLAKQNPLDPGDPSGYNILRNRAEMEIRYQSHLDEIAELKARGVRLVIASTHADCSERCARWQGLVYSLDGTYGVTDDGRRYQPLENATDIYYTTKAGKTYKNGLLGFNCRHYLVEYRSGYRFPSPNAATERREYKITQKQRQMEAQVRRWRTRAIYDKGQNEEGYKQSRKKALEWNRAYIEFSQKNNRAYYPDRTKII